ncbi:N-acetylglucosamine kinase [Agromyces binzhouensis]|uniref:N-acetylglucosamine kinase n=1 Tax=Agromyces binzhouensis TaxID=1817495 RepID=UPI00363B144C
MSSVLSVDIGQTGSRFSLSDGDTTHSPIGVRALTDARQVQTLAARIAQQVPPGIEVSSVGIGLSGYVDYSAAPAALAAAVRKRLRAQSVAVAADAVTAFLGTVGPRAGTVAICGTGVAALGVGNSGSARRADARGYLLGDYGSGFWLGQRGLQAALDAIEGRGEPTLLARASIRLGTPQDIYHDAMASVPPPKYVAGFAPDVITAATEGDAVARRILDAGADHLARTIHIAQVVDSPVGLTGGLTRSHTYVEAVRRALGRLGIEPAELVVQSDAGLAGARILAENSAIRPAFAGFIAVRESE